MPVVINTNYAATVAANNLATSNSLLQRSLNRLSSGSKIVNPADDAGGLAVSMKLSATAKRQRAASDNLANSVSFLQSQDGALKVIGKVFERISELKTLSGDPTKNSTDLANYDAEFTQLRAQLTSLAADQFNGISLFGSSTLSVASSENGGGIIEVGGGDLQGTSSLPTAFSFAGSTENNTLAPTGAGTFTVTSGGIYLSVDGTYGPNYVWLDNPGDTAVYDGAGGWTFSGSGISGNPGSMASGATSLYMEGSVNTSYVGSGSFAQAGSSSFGVVSTASDLSALELSEVTDAIQEIATLRAINGAQQSRLQFATEVLTVNKANIEAANSRITDVDVAEESTQLARYNILVQAGTAMLSQANQSAQSALRLIN
jgi:flagellin-like hook-associated protein FlgL